MFANNIFNGKKALVLGLARSGESAAKLLATLGADVLVSDQKDEGSLKDAVLRLKSQCPNVKFYLGGHPEEIFEGIDIVVLSPGVPINLPVLNKARQLSIPIIGEIELAFGVCRAPIVAITGTKGKSTTTTLTGQILSKGFTDRRVIVAGNIGTPLSDYVLSLTESDLLVLEVSSFQLETTVNFRPKVAVILNITQDHMDRHSSIDEYISAKHKIFANQTQEDYTVLNADDMESSKCANLTKGKVVLFSCQNKLDKGVYVEDSKVKANLKGVLPAFDHLSDETICDVGILKVPGKHNLQNALAAISVGLLFGIGSDVIVEALSSFRGLEHTLEIVGEINGVKFINDSKATNVISLKAALESLNGKIVLIMGGRDKGNDYEPVKPLVKEKVSHLIAIGESKDKIRASFNGLTVLHEADTMESAVRLAYELADPGDNVLLSPACASFDMFRDYAERGKVFKESVNGLKGRSNES